ncbi:hypothetical protein TNCV_796891 [Trichonephila clavipes]|uniref:Uncharacterized protein n=1 Tax=Trichonephila clavipes TaxID=2585209 RepID=A0A8X6WIV6_TRICX|nr:hypothetical protein TNCV_796891 [Trichonephila clavipes]
MELLKAVDQKQKTKTDICKDFVLVNSILLRRSGIQLQYSQSKSPKVFIPSTAIKHNHQCLKIHVSKRLFTSTAELIASQNNAHYTRWFNQDQLSFRRESLFIDAAEASRNITARVIERNVSGPLHRFLEGSR